MPCLFSELQYYTHPEISSLDEVYKIGTKSLIFLDSTMRTFMVLRSVLPSDGGDAWGPLHRKSRRLSLHSSEKSAVCGVGRGNQTCRDFPGGIRDKSVCARSCIWTESTLKLAISLSFFR